MTGEPTIVVELGKEAVEYLVGELDSMARVITRELETDPNIDQEMARLTRSKMLAIAQTFVDAALRVGIVLEWFDTRPDLEDN